MICFALQRATYVVHLRAILDLDGCIFATIRICVYFQGLVGASQVFYLEVLVLSLIHI